MLLRRSLPVLALTLLLVPAAASAQVSDADKATARVLAQQGQDALDARDFATAADRFSRARELVQVPTLSLGLARAQVGLGRWIAAQETYNRILREGVPASAPPVLAKAVADARKELDALEPRIPSIVINVKGATEFTVLLDGQPLPRAVLGVNRLVDPGRHVVSAESEGFISGEVTVTVAERKGETVTVTLTPKRGGSGDTVDPWREGAPPPRPVTAPRPVVDAPAPPPRAVGGKPAPPPRAAGGSVQKTLGFVGIGVGGAGLVMGAVAGGIAIGKHGDLAKICSGGHCLNQQSALDSYHLAGNLSTAGFVVGGVLAATGVVLVVTAPKTRAPTDAWIAPFVGAGFAGAEGRF